MKTKSFDFLLTVKHWNGHHFKSDEVTKGHESNTEGQDFQLSTKDDRIGSNI